MSFIKILSRLANLNYFLLVLSLILIIPFTPLEIPTIYGGDYINRISIPYRYGGVKALSFLTGFTLLPIISSPHLPIISDARSAIYYVDATNGSEANNATSQSTPWKTIAKVNASRLNPRDEREVKSKYPRPDPTSFILMPPVISKSVTG